eukprot:TRINITY_DN1813_c0_g3_i2.p1 TRINITY_DN1813_c0_g3~~TRINITY_DN1813_c0_g3_i2.p1  ORF type:complete len:152 (+),score=20.93 TRINITY_DN1813_c0_g3_i2:361-816(+)
MSRKEKERLTSIFMALDKNGDGCLTREELMEGYMNMYKDEERAMKEVESLMAIGDVDKNGLIDYSEFLLAAGNKKQMLSKSNVKQAFDLFDIVCLLSMRVGQERIDLCCCNKEGAGDGEEIFGRYLEGNRGSGRCQQRRRSLLCRIPSYDE